GPSERLDPCCRAGSGVPESSELPAEDREDQRKGDPGGDEQEPPARPASPPCPPREPGCQRVRPEGEELQGHGIPALRPERLEARAPLQPLGLPGCAGEARDPGQKRVPVPNDPAPGSTGLVGIQIALPRATRAEASTLDRAGG